jgi:serine protease inhibitor
MHGVGLDVAKENTEAAAATAIVLSRTSILQRKTLEQFRVDRPFLFYLVDVSSGIWSCSRVESPTRGKRIFHGRSTP